MSSFPHLSPKVTDSQRNLFNRLPAPPSQGTIGSLKAKTSFASMQKVDMHPHVIKSQENFEKDEVDVTVIPIRGSPIKQESFPSPKQVLSTA